MSTVAPVPQVAPNFARHPLGLPQGSVRALLTLLVLGILWTLMILQDYRDISIPVYLYYLVFLILGHFFAAHGHTITGMKSPLYFPRGSIRMLIFAGFVGVFAWRFYKHGDFLALGSPDLIEFKAQGYLPAVLLGAFFLGICVSRTVMPFVSTSAGPPPWFQDFLAWIALLAVIGLVAEALIQFVINTSLDTPLNPQTWQLILSALVAFYFGARS